MFRRRRKAKRHFGYRRAGTTKRDLRRRRKGAFAVVPDVGRRSRSERLSPNEGEARSPLGRRL
ncbi:MAG: hypothetical protein Q8K98_08750 [Bacteroidota bacterium]|nr:hypothetical protein [Bacteroidota bacterium]